MSTPTTHTQITQSKQKKEHNKKKYGNNEIEIRQRIEKINETKI